MDSNQHTGPMVQQITAPDGACPACGGAVARARVSTAFWEDEDLAVIRDVPALVCQSCRERYFEDDTVMRLDLMRARGFAGQGAVMRLSVPVYAFPCAEKPR